MSNLIETCRSNLSANGFDAYVAENRQQAGTIFFEQIAPQITFTSISWGDSITRDETGDLYHHYGGTHVAIGR